MGKCCCYVEILCCGVVCGCIVVDLNRWVVLVVVCGDVVWCCLVCRWVVCLV